MPKKMMPKNKKQFMKESIDWLRNNDPGNLRTVDDVTAKSFAELVGVEPDSSGQLAEGIHFEWIAGTLDRRVTGIN